jgi:protein gp37
MPTRIEWCDETRNPVRGLCKMGCPYCYARRIYARFLWDKEVRFEPAVLDDLQKLKPSRVFVGSTHDLMGEWIPSKWIEEIIGRCGRLRKHIFLFLSKNPSRYREFKWPANCWLGTTVEDEARSSKRLLNLLIMRPTNYIFASTEPLLGRISFYGYWTYLDWLIIGGLTPRPAHREEWIGEMVAAADAEGIPVFVKANAGYPMTRQAFPPFSPLERVYRRTRDRGR